MLSEKKDYIKNETIICDCGSYEHTFHLGLCDWGKGEDVDKLTPAADQNVELYLTVHLSNYLSFWGRVKHAFLYIFGYQSRFGSFDEVQISYHDVPRIEAVLSEYKAKVAEYEEILQTRGYSKSEACTSQQEQSATAQE